MISGGNASVYVSDIGLAIKFYTEALGLKLKTRIGDEWAEIDAERGFVIGLHPARVPATVAPGTIGAINIELSVSGPHTIEAVVDVFQARGVRFNGPIANFPNMRLPSFSDPDGNVLLLAQQLPVPS